MGADLILVGRNERAAQLIMAKIAGGSGAGKVEFIPADISSLTDVRRLGDDLCRRRAIIDVLVNNAGARFDHYQTSSDGLELTFATNHLGHFLLTALLLDRLMAAPQGRVITVASGAHAAATAGDWILSRNDYDRKAAYTKSKLANLMFSYELAERLRHTAVVCAAVDPGGVATRLGRNNGLIPWLRHLTFYALRGQLQSARQASRTTVQLASGDAVTGKYYRGLEEIRSSDISYDRKAAGDLWRLSLERTGLSQSIGSSWHILEPFQ